MARALLVALLVWAPLPLAQSESTVPPSLDRMMFVDCLLPAPVHKMGGRMNYLGPRHAVRATTDECEIRGGEYVAYDRANYATALKVWLPGAERGDEQAQIYVGEIYEKGLGVEPDYARAASWYEKAANQGSKQGMTRLAYLYEQGLGVPKDEVRALNLYKSAAGITSGDVQLVFESEVAATNSRIAELTSQLEERTTELTTLRNQLQKTQADLEAAQAGAAQARRRQDELRKKVKALESQPPSSADAQELNKLRGELQQRDQDVREREATIAQLQQSSTQQNAALNQRLMQVQSDDSALKAQLGAARDDTSSLRSQLAAAQARQVALEQETAKLKDEVQKNDRALQKAQAALLNKPPDPKATTEDPHLRAELAGAQITLERQRATIQALDAERAKQGDDIKRLESSLRDAAEREKRATADASTARAQLASLQAELLEKNRRIDALATTIQADQSQIAKDREQLAQETARLGAGDAEVQRLNKALLERETAVSRAKAEREGLAAEVKTYQDRVNSLNAAQKASPSQAQLASLQAQLASLQAQLDEKNRRIDALATTIQADQRQIANDREQLAKDTARVGTQDADAVRVNKALADREAALSRAKAEKEGLAAEVKTYQDQVNTLNEALKASQSQVASLQAQLNEKSRRVDALATTIQADQSQITKDREQLAKDTARGGAQDAEAVRLNKALVDRDAALSRAKAEKEGLEKEIKSLQAQLFAQRSSTSTPRPPPPPVSMSSGELGIASSYALVIANYSYKNAKDYPTLPSVKKDATDVRIALQRYGFKGPPVLDNPSGTDIETAIAKLLGEVGDKDSVLIYFAGHGEGGTAVESTTYWLPYDADPNNRASWVSTGWVTDMIRETKARHVLVVADSCYSGAMIRTTNLRLVTSRSAAEPDRMKLLAQLRSRTVLTSGGNEPVLSNGPGGNSIFAHTFTNILNQNKNVLDASALYELLADGMQQSFADTGMVTTDRPAQRPRYAVLANAGHLNGDFLFVPAPVTVASLR